MERRVDELGRISIPKEIRVSLGFTPGSKVKFDVSSDSVTIKKSDSGCIFCGTIFELKEVKGIRMCQRCVSDIQMSKLFPDA